MLASFAVATNEGLIQKTCLLNISEEVCHEDGTGSNPAAYIWINRPESGFVAFGYGVRAFYEGESSYTDE